MNSLSCTTGSVAYNMSLYVAGNFTFQVLVGGRERTAKEWEALVCADSLFKLENAIPSTGELSVFSFVKIWWACFRISIKHAGVKRLLNKANISARFSGPSVDSTVFSHLNVRWLPANLCLTLSPRKRGWRLNREWTIDLYHRTTSTALDKWTSKSFCE